MKNGKVTWQSYYAELAAGTATETVIVAAIKEAGGNLVMRYNGCLEFAFKTGAAIPPAVQKLFKEGPQKIRRPYTDDWAPS